MRRSPKEKKREKKKKTVFIKTIFQNGESTPSHLLVGQLFAEVGHDVTKLGSGDEAVAVLVEHLERLLELLLRVGIFHLASHEVEKLGEVDGAVAVRVNLVDHVLQFGFRGVLAQRAHHGAELLRGDGTVSILVEEGESLLELGNLLVGKFLSRHVVCKMC